MRYKKTYFICLYRICGICMQFTRPLRIIRIPWPPPWSRENKPGVISDYKNLTEIHPKEWLNIRGIKTSLVGKEKSSELVVPELSSIICKVGITNGILRDA
jgi:hypothetical protein